MNVLHVGCGGRSLPSWLHEHEETRLDIDPGANADIKASMTDMGDIGEFDFIYCSHALEHLHPRDVLLALSEFKRCLKVGGCAHVIVPDVEDVKPTFDVLYTTESGVPITGHDLYFGHAPFTEDSPHMQHRVAFMQNTLRAAFEAVGFGHCVIQRISGYNLLAVAVKQ